MAEFSSAMAITERLAGSGWLTPDTYVSRHYGDIPTGSAIYIFLAYHPDDYARAMVAYVGMSTGLRARLNRHDVLPLIRRAGFWPARWFKRVPTASLRDLEREHIQRFDPPWNTIGRPKGLCHG